MRHQISTAMVMRTRRGGGRDGRIPIWLESHEDVISTLPRRRNGG